MKMHEYYFMCVDTASVPASHLVCYCAYQGNWRFPFLCHPCPCGRVGTADAWTTVLGLCIGSGSLNTSISSWHLCVTASLLEARRSGLEDREQGVLW